MSKLTDFYEDDFNAERNFYLSDRFEDMLDELWNEYLHPVPAFDEMPENWADDLIEPSDEEMEIINQNANELLMELEGWNDFLESLK